MNGKQRESNRLNIILINCDDLGYGDLGCYGSTRNDTPYIDRLAAGGVRFTDFYMASPVCSASRAAMLTGCYPQRIGFGNYQVLFPGQAQGLNPKERTIARQLKEVGYDTKIVGKWHCGDQPEFLPTRHGFDEYFGIPFSNDMGRQANNAFKHPPLPLLRNEEVIQQQPDQRAITERYVDECLQFMRRKRENPFFLYLAHMYVHVPLFVSKQFLESSRNGAYGGAVACIDWATGMIDAELSRLGIRDETVVIFTSDNGSRARDEGGSNAPLRGTKAQTWEGGQRVPCIMRWPGKIAGGTTCEGIAASIDLFATLAELTGAPLPPDTAIDSISLADTVLHGKPARRTTFAYYKGANLEAVRKGDWKLHFCKTERTPGGPESNVIAELYNLRDDIGETTNVYEQHPDIVREIEAEAEEFRRLFGDQRLNRTGSEVRDIGVCSDPKPLTEYDENHPYMIAYYDLADMPTMAG
ncbi:MAG TPA: sulfatase [Candidatus Latescibacteria bacterium]|nr:sulfatase [Candidatus Latescibacterota bacterium]